LTKLLDTFNFPVDPLSTEFNLYKPNFERSVAGVFPELFRGLNLDDPWMTIRDCVENRDVARKIEESFPSGYENIIFLICDAVGVERLQHLGGMLWDNLNNEGTIATSVFPSMTSTVMTSLSFGKLPSDHGLVGYNIYNEHLGEVWNSLNLQYIKDGTQKTVLEDVSMDKLVNGKPIIDRIHEATDFPVTFVGPSEYQGQPNLIDLINHSIPLSTYEAPVQAVQKTVQALNQDLKNQLISVYIPYADYAGHAYGPESSQYADAIRGIEQAIAMISQHPKVKNGSTLIALTSDHGQSQVDHGISHWMDRKTWKEHKENGLVFSSSGRVIHGYFDKEKLDIGKEVLEEFADNKGLVINKSEAIELVGGNNLHHERIGDHLMIMEDKYLYDVPEVVLFGNDMRLNGQHGSLTEKELFVPVGIFGGNN
jgi:hypothetical protein